MSSEKIIKNVSPNGPHLRRPVTKRQVVDARSEAREILGSAEKEAATIRENALAFASETREKAYREGYEAALLKWNTLLLEAHEKRDNVLTNVEQDVLRLAV